VPQRPETGWSHGTREEVWQGVAPRAQGVEVCRRFCDWMRTGVLSMTVAWIPSIGDGMCMCMRCDTMSVV